MLKQTLLLLILLPIATALTCDDVTDNTLKNCNQIMLDNISYNEKQGLIANLIYTSTDYANHTFIENWNTNINFNTAPYGVETKSSGYIKDAWLKIIAIMPSVLDNNTLLSPGTGKILSAFNYRVEIPSATMNGDCKTEYNLESNKYWLSVYLNNNLIGTSALVNFNSNTLMNFKTTLSIQTVTSIEHYKTYVYCCCHSEEGCCGYCEECRYEKTEYKTHEVFLEDTKQAEHYLPVIQPEIKIIDKYYDTTVGILKISNFTSFSLDFKDSYLKQFNYFYDVDINLQPYDVFTLRANKFIKKDASNINVEQLNTTYKFYVKDYSDCKITYNDHFHSWQQDCDLDYSPILFKINTDKLQYNENEIIKIELEPKDTELKLKYGNNEIIAKNNAELKAEYPFNKITAYYADRETQKIIHVRKKDSWDFVINFSVFSGVLYFLYALIKKCVGFFL